MSSDSEQGYDHDIAQRWLEKLAKWDGRLHAAAQKRLKPIAEAAGGLESTASLEERRDYRRDLETIVRRSRPVLPIRGDRISTDGASIDEDEESRLVVAALQQQSARVEPIIPLVGRIDVANDPGGRPFLGTGWLVDADVVVTNRHVAELIARWNGAEFVFRTGRFGNLVSASLDFKHEMDGGAGAPVQVAAVIWIERDENGPDIAFLRLARARDGGRPNRIEIAESDAAPGTRAAVLGYPARAPADVIPDQAWMDRIYRNTYDVKRIAPGLVLDPDRGSATHDCTTLGGNSGSVVIDTATGKAVGLHYAGAYLLENYAVPASTIGRYLRERPWHPESAARPAAPPPASPPPRTQPAPPSSAPLPGTPAAPGASTAVVSVTIPLVVTVSLGQPTLGAAPHVAATALPGSVATGRSVKSSARAFVEAYRGNGLLGAAAGRTIVDGRVIDQPCIRAVAHPDRIAEAKARLPSTFDGLPVQVRVASLMELSEGGDGGLAEAVVTSISYNDRDRTGPEFSFEPIDQDMTVLCHVGPERSWSVLKDFLGKARRELVCSMYEFHAGYIADALADRLEHDTKLKLVLATQSRDPRSGASEDPDANSFNRAETFAEWERTHGGEFERVFVPLGSSGLVANAYHIKVTVRDQRSVWLSSGNWKVSSQPAIKRADLNDPAKTAKAGNREWHLAIDNAELSKRFRSHILEDLAESKRLGGLPEAAEGPETFVDVPDAMLEAMVAEAPPAPARVLEPLKVEGRIRVKPLLTPDRKGAVYSKAVLALIRSARRQLLFQIPYITVPPTDDSSSFINSLVEALTEKAGAIEDVRVILRSDRGQWKPGATTLSDGGMDVARQVRHVSSTHTKGMVVDGETVLVGSHNWSGAGVTLNRDASLIFEGNRQIAEYFKEAFELDWARARPAAVDEAVAADRGVRIAPPGSRVPPGHKRMRLADYLQL